MATIIGVTSEAERKSSLVGHHPSVAALQCAQWACARPGVLLRAPACCVGELVGRGREDQRGRGGDKCKEARQ
ncbi:hypothetical protein NQZ68_025890 [Dissostichus eleginoides]|nr:hypothetical protein NQZ68_025890 [Dissostichus eleginoides]